MANKVLSIKINENDIERLKKYYGALIKTGFLSSETMSLNAFYKHLLLDYLENDIHNAFAAFSNHGMLPKCINPEEMNDNGNFILSNIYNLDIEMFEIYKKCVKEELSRSVNTMKENARQFNEVIKSNVVITEGWMYEMDYISLDDIGEQEVSFWEDKVFEIIDLQEQKYKENEMGGDIEMIEKATISAESKQKLIAQIVEYEEKRKQNYSITHGMRTDK